MQVPPIKDYKLNNILPGESNSREQETPLGGYTFYVIEATHSRFAVQINDGPLIRGKAANGISFPAAFKIEKIRFYNEDGTGLALNLIVQIGEFIPLNDLFNVSTDEITPTLRSDTPLIVGDAVATAPADTAVDTWFKLLDADEFRAEVWLKTDAAAAGAYWNTSDPGAPTEIFSRDIQATADASGFLKLKTTAAIWVRLKTNHSVRALTFKYSV